MTRRIESETPAASHSLWLDTAPTGSFAPPLEGESAVDVAVVGGGFTGLSAALRLADGGASVVVLEAESPGWGASGRNGGQVIPGLKQDPEALAALLGPERGERLARFAGAAPDLVFDLIGRHGIECEARRGGWLQLAHDAAAAAICWRRAESWAARGAPVDALNAEAAAQRLGAERYAGGLFDGRGGSLQPLKFVRGLAAAAARAGAAIHGGSRAVRLERATSGFLVLTARGRLHAERVLLCANAYADRLADPLRRTVVPVRSTIVATQPLSANLRSTILPNGEVASDTRRLLRYFRIDGQGRLLMGGRGAYEEAPLLARQRDLRAEALRLFPQLEGAQWTHHWAGYVAMTADHLPHLNEVAPGVTAALGYNGRGVAMATATGRLLADHVLGADPRDLDLPLTAPRPIPLHGFRRAGVAAATLWARWRDRPRG